MIKKYYVIFFAAPESVDDTQTLRESWLRDNFVKATRDSNGYIDQTTCIELIKKLDQQVATHKVKQKIHVSFSYYLVFYVIAIIFRIQNFKFQYIFFYYYVILLIHSHKGTNNGKNKLLW